MANFFKRLFRKKPAFKEESAGNVGIKQNIMFQINKDCSFSMIYVEGGAFTIGNTNNIGNECEKVEVPPHLVKVKDFYIGETVVTQGLWRSVMGREPEDGGWEEQRGKGDNYPAYLVSWIDAQEFIKKLNSITNRKFCLPTEAEWEYAARGGKNGHDSKYSGSNDINLVGWTKANGGETSHPVKNKKPNEIGIYDMTGNVWEWCQDGANFYDKVSQAFHDKPISGACRELRGGGWDGAYRDATYRVSFRTGRAPNLRAWSIGFRLALRLDENQQDNIVDGYDYVDLGLPSGLCWAACNLGANRPDEPGIYFQWGGAKIPQVLIPNYSQWEMPHNQGGSFTKYNTIPKYGIVDNRLTLEPDDDAASYNWSKRWRIPTREDYVELIDNCSWEWEQQNDVYGYLVTSKKNGNSLFFPTTGMSVCKIFKDTKNAGCYWTSSLHKEESDKAWGFDFTETHQGMDMLYGIPRFFGLAIRPVCSSKD